MADTQTVAPPPGFVMDGASTTPAPPSGFQLDTQQEPDTGAANKAFSRYVGNALASAWQSTKDVATIYGPLEAGFNAATGMILGFPMYVGGAAGGLFDKYALGRDDVDPKEIAETLQKFVTYQPSTQAGKRLTAHLMYPLEKLTEAGSWAGHKVADVTGSATAAAITDASVQMLPPVLLGETVRKFRGQTVTNEDMKNASAIVADGDPKGAASVETSMRATYEQTGIGPYSVMEEAERNPAVKAELLDPKVDVPPSIRAQLASSAPDGPALDLSGLTRSETEAVENPFQGEVELNAGINPAATLRAVADSYTPYVGVEPQEVMPGAAPRTTAPRAGFVDAVQKLLSPASRGDIASEQAAIMRANFGEMARQREVALESLKGYAAEFDKMPVEDNIKFIDSMERGTPDPQFAAEASALRQLLDGRREQVQALGTGQLQNFDENYFPHMWQDEKAAAQLFSRRPLEGSKAFLKERTIPYTVDGMRWRIYDADGDFVKSFDTEAQARSAVPEGGRVGAPLQPITTNPVELALLKAREMDRYVYGQRIFGEMKDAGLARFVRFGDKPPEGWTKINDKIARVYQFSEADKGMIVRGEYYAPDEAATLINNHLSPGLRGNAFYDAWRGVGMAMNSMQLGMSAFHVGFTTLDSMVSRVALGVKQLSRGDIVEGATNVAMGASPVQPFVNIYKGDRLLRAYLGKLDDPSLAPIVDAITSAGGRIRMDDFYRNATVNEFKQALRTGRSWDAAKAFLPTVLDRVNAPIFEWLVPRQKLGVFFDMAKDWLEKNPNADVMAKREGLGKLWDSVDNRMGQLVYDNVFWNRALKDSLMATVRSVGWNFGTFREIGGGLLDLRDIASVKGLTDRTAYIIALPLVAGIYGALTQYAYTGEGPKEMKDLFFPRTGRTRPDGSEDRVSLPTYMKDVYAYAEDAKNFMDYGADPTQTLKNKMHPLVSTVSEMLNNEDYYGSAIRNPSAPATVQLYDEANFLAHQIEPFSLRNYQQQAQLRGAEPSFYDYLTSPSMVGVTPAPGYMTKSKEELESAAIARLREPLIRKFREEVKNGADTDTVIQDMLRAGLSKQDIRYVMRTSGDQQRPHRLRKFGDNSEEQ